MGRASGSGERRYLPLPVLALLGWATASAGADAAPLPFRNEPSVSVWPVLLSLVLVVGLIGLFWLAARYARRRGLPLPFASTPGSRLRVDQSLRVSTRLSVHLIIVDGRTAVVAENGAAIGICWVPDAAARQPDPGQCERSA